MSAITAKASRKMKKYAVLTREPRCFLGSFDFSWEQRKVSDLAEKTYGGGTPTTSNEAYWNGDIPWIQSSDVVDGKLLGVEPRKWITQDGLNNSAAQLIPGNSIAIITRVGVGKLAFMPYSYATSQDFLSLSKLNAEPLFTVYACYKKLQSELNAVQGTSIKGITKDELLAKNIMVPRYAEQQQIGAFFKQLDNLITLHQRKYVFLFGFFQAFISMIFTASTFSWEQRKLGDMMNVTSVKRIHQSDWTDSGVRFLRARDIVAAAKNEEPDDYLYISKEKYEEYSALSGKVGVSDLLVTGVGTIGVPYLVRNLEPLYFKDGNIIWFQNSDKIDGKFLFYSFSAEQIQGFINESAGIGTVGTYTIESGKKTPISLPNQIEQAKVGEFFQQLDNLITLHQRQPFLQSPPDISLIVQLTPPFYTFSWEQRKLGELVDRVVRKNTNNESTLPLTISAQYGLVDQITYFNNRVASRDVSNYYLVLNGEFAYNKSTSDGYPFGAVKRLDLYEKGVLSTLYIVFAPKKEQQIDSDYLTVFFDTDRWHKGVAERAAEGARNHGLLNISAEDFFDIDLSVPKDIVEQKQIGAFIRQLDNLITLHQRKGKAAVTGCSNGANNSKGVCCKARDFGYKCHKKDESQ